MASPILKATQLTLIFINILIVFLGIAAMAAGTWVLLYREQAQVLTMIDVATRELGLLQNAAILLIISGLVLFALGFVGCSALRKNQRCLQAVYIGLVVLCVLVTIAACVVDFLFREQVEDDLLNHLNSKLRTEYQGFSRSTVDFSRAWDYAQVEFECCGVQSKEDFRQAAKWTVLKSAVIPLSCCVQKDRDAFLDDNFYNLADIDCVLRPTSVNSFIDTPCYGVLKDWMEKEILIMGAIGIAAIVLQVLAVLFMICLKQQPAKSSSSGVLYRDMSSSRSTI